MSSHVSANSLVDSGSDHCFIDTTFMNKYALSPYSVGPYRLRYMDWSTSTITQGITLQLRFPTGEILSQEFLITPLDSPCDMVLRYNWLFCFNLLIDWNLKSLTFHRTSLPENSIFVPFMETPKHSQSVSHVSETLDIPESIPLDATATGKAPLVLLISAAAFACAI